MSVRYNHGPTRRCDDGGIDELCSVSGIFFPSLLARIRSVYFRRPSCSGSPLRSAEGCRKGFLGTLASYLLFIYFFSLVPRCQNQRPHRATCATIAQQPTQHRPPRAHVATRSRRPYDGQQTCGPLPRARRDGRRPHGRVHGHPSSAPARYRQDTHAECAASPSLPPPPLLGCL